MSLKCRKGDFVHVTFFDHVEDGDKPMKCHVVGRLKAKGAVIGGRRFLVVEAWFTEGDDEAASIPSNSKTYTILLSTVESVTTLTPEYAECHH